MVTLIIEIWLTVVAWRKGWRGHALLPLAGLFAGGLLIGMAVGASGGKLSDVFPLAVLLDLACIGVLIRLAVRGPRPAQVLSLAAAPAPVEVPDSAERPAA